MSKGNIVIGALAGVAVGALLGMVFAPEKGSDTRKKISKKSADTIEDLQEKFDNLLDNVTQKFEAVKEEAALLDEKNKKA